MSSDTEIVLPSGRFARIRQILWEDFVLSYDQDINVMATKLAARVATIDGASVTVEELMKFDLGEFMPINQIIGTIATEAMRTRKGIA